MNDHAAEPGWGRKAADFIIGSTKAIIAIVGGVAVFLVGLPDVTPFVPEGWRPGVQIVLVALTGVATWYGKYEALGKGDHEADGAAQ